MCKKTLFATVMLAQAALAQLAEPARRPPSEPKLVAPVSSESLQVNDHERLLVIAPHPDDETLGAAGLIQRVIERGGTVRVVLVTAGDAYVEVVAHETHKSKPTSPDFVAFGERRIKESQDAMRRFDHEDRIQVQVLGFPDGGLDTLLSSSWSRHQPYRSATTDATDPPYDREALRPDISYTGENLRQELSGVFVDVRPTLIALPDPLDNHPDHHATSVFGLLALNDWLARPGFDSSESNGTARAPRILAYLVHWPHWPPDAKDAAQPFSLPADCPAHGLGALSLSMSDREQSKKADALACYTSQQMVMSGMARYLREAEPFIQLSLKDVRDALHYLTTAAVTTRSSFGHPKLK